MAFITDALKKIVICRLQGDEKRQNIDNWRANELARDWDGSKIPSMSKVMVARSRSIWGCTEIEALVKVNIIMYGVDLSIHACQ